MLNINLLQIHCYHVSMPRAYPEETSLRFHSNQLVHHAHEPPFTEEYSNRKLLATIYSMSKSYELQI